MDQAARTPEDSRGVPWEPIGSYAPDSQGLPGRSLGAHWIRRMIAEDTIFGGVFAEVWNCVSEMLDAQPMAKYDGQLVIQPLLLDPWTASIS